MLLPLVLTSLLVSAPDTIVLHYMPPGTELTLPSGDKVRYFTFPEYKLLLKMDETLGDQEETIRIYKDLDFKYSKIVSAKDEIIRSLLTDRKILTDQKDRAEENWHAAEKAQVEAAGGPIWPYILAAGGVVVGIVGITAFVVEKLSHQATP